MVTNKATPTSALLLLLLGISVCSLVQPSEHKHKSDGRSCQLPLTCLSGPRSV